MFYWRPKSFMGESKRKNVQDCMKSNMFENQDFCILSTSFLNLPWGVNFIALIQNRPYSFGLLAPYLRKYQLEIPNRRFSWIIFGLVVTKI